MQHNNYTPYYLGIFILSIFIIAEVFGRRKHIGFWWSFTLMLFGGIPGWIAIALSPSAKKTHNQGNIIIKYLGIALIIFFGLPLLVTTLFQELHTSFHIYRTAFLLGFCVCGIYLYKLGLGEIQNNYPKFYYQSFTIRPFWKVVNDPPFPENKVYHVITDLDKEEIQTFTFQDLQHSNQITEDTLIWHKGLSSWVKASEIRELRYTIFSKPPPFPVKKTQKPKTKNALLLFIESVYSVEGGLTFLVVFVILFFIFCISYIDHWFRL
jgi:hypothetical protein